MKWHRLVVAAATMSGLSLLGPGVDAQIRGQTAVTPDDGHPADISHGKIDSGLVYTDSRGMTLYAMNMRYAGFLAQGGNPAKYCTDDCAKSWMAVMATTDAKPVGSWKVLDGVGGPQWSYKGDPVFTYVGDRAPGSAAGADRDDLFRLLNYVLPMPQVTAPAPVKAVFVKDAYILEDGQGHALFTGGESCDADCGKWTPFEAGLANQGIGDWTIVREGDHPQWAYRGRLVYVTQEQQPASAPARGMVLTVHETLSNGGEVAEAVAVQ